MRSSLLSSDLAFFVHHWRMLFLRGCFACSKLFYPWRDQSQNIGFLVGKAKYSRWFELFDLFRLAWCDIILFMTMCVNDINKPIWFEHSLLTTLLRCWYEFPHTRSFGPWQQMRSCYKIMGSMWRIQWSTRCNRVDLLGIHDVMLSSCQKDLGQGSPFVPSFEDL